MINLSATVSLSTSAFLFELMNLSTDIVWKNQALSNDNESSESQIEEEIFLSAKKGVLTFDTIYQLDRYTLEQLHYTEDQIQAALDDKYTVPASMRSAALNIYIQHLIQYDNNTGHYINYIEQNNYYRMLNGLPDLNDSEYIYQNKYSDMSTTIPIHLLPLVDRYRMEADGYLTELLKSYPSKKYIKYLASRQIDIFNARNAERFAILWMNSSEYTNLYNDFREQYNKSRMTIIRIYYNTVYSKNNSSYEGFMAMCCVFMTIQLMHYKYLDMDITRDFYDLDSIKYIYESYGIPFYNSIPLEYHKKIVKNVNRLLGYKGSTRVFFDLFDIFNYGDVDVYEYYLLRTRKFLDNKPVTATKQDGTPDNRAMYDIKFGKVKLYDDPPMELSDATNHIPYEDMTTIDPYWVSDKELLDKLYDEEFNYLETKYIGIQTVFDMYKILFESSYFFKMLLDNKAALSATNIYYAPINSTVNIFDLTIYICALITRKYGYEGNIPTDIPSVAKVLGYNFSISLSTLRNEIIQNPYLKSDTTLLSIFKSMNVNSLESINATYGKIVSLRDYVVEALSKIRDKDAWMAYYNLYNTVMNSKVLESTYTKHDGTIAKTFADMLSDTNIDLYIREISDDLNIDSELKTALILYKRSFNNLSYIEYSDGIDISLMIEHLFKILNFFKSAKAELTGYNIVYTISQRGVNFFKLIDQISLSKYKDGTKSRFEYLIDILMKLQSADQTRSDIKYLKDKLLDDGADRTHISDKIISLQDSLKISTKELFDLSHSDYEKLLIYDILTDSDSSLPINNTMLMSDSLHVIYERTVE